MPAKINLIGRRFDRLVVSSAFERTPSGTRWLCLCDCGNNVFKLTTQLRSAQAIGCKQCEPASRAAAHLKHGESRGVSQGGKTKLYVVWKGIHSRCRDPGHTSFKYYGGKGISVCAEWNDYLVFKLWALSAGYAAGLTIERKDSKGDYCAGNCEWVTASENSKRAHLRLVG